jgi:hypothetical protein
MPPAVAARVVMLGAALLLVLLPAVAGAQAELQMWVNPDMGKQISRSDYRFTFYPDREVEDQNTDFGLSEHRVTLFLPVYQDAANEWGLSGRVRFQDIDTSARFPEAGGRFPSELWEASATASYRHKFDNGWIAGVALTAGSASDKPFHSVDELFYRGALMLRVPQGERNAWIFSILYASDQDIFDLNVPVPGIAYVWNPSDRFNIVIGVPFSSIQFKPVETLTLEAQYFPERRVRARATWEIFRPLRAYVDFDWDHDKWFRSDRDDKDDMIFYYEKRLTAGVRFDLRNVGFEVSGGWAFDRFYFEGESYSDRKDNRISVEDGPFIVGRISVRF